MHYTVDSTQNDTVCPGRKDRIRIEINAAFLVPRKVVALIVLRGEIELFLGQFWHPAAHSNIPLVTGAASVGRTVITSPWMMRQVITLSLPIPLRPFL